MGVFWGLSRQLLQENKYPGDYEGDYPSQAEGVADCEEGPFPAACFCLDGTDGGNTRKVN